MATLYQWIVVDMANKLKKDDTKEVQRCADNYQRNLCIDAKKLIEEARQHNAKASYG